MFRKNKPIDSYAISGRHQIGTAQARQVPPSTQQRFKASDFTLHQTKDSAKGLHEIILGLNGKGPCDRFKEKIKSYINSNSKELQTLLDENKENLTSIAKGHRKRGVDAAKFAPLLFAHAAGREIIVLEKTGKNEYRVSDLQAPQLPSLKECDIRGSDTEPLTPIFLLRSNASYHVLNLVDGTTAHRFFSKEKDNEANTEASDNAKTGQAVSLGDNAELKKYAEGTVRDTKTHYTKNGSGKTDASQSVTSSPPAPPGFSVRQIEKDGNCFYRAIAFEMGGVGSSGEVRNLRGHLEQFIISNEMVLMNDSDLLSIVTASGSDEPGDIFTGLRQTIRTDGSWAGAYGDLVPHLAAQLLGREVHIHQMNGNGGHLVNTITVNTNLPVGQQLSSNNPPIHLLLQPDREGQSGHYDLLESGAVSHDGPETTKKNQRNSPMPTALENGNRGRAGVQRGFTEGSLGETSSVKHSTEASLGSSGSDNVSQGSLSPGQKNLRQNQGERIIAAKNFSKQRMPRDGDSLYRSVLTGLHPNKTPSENDIKNLRRQVANYIANNFEGLDKSNSFEGKEDLKKLRIAVKENAKKGNAIEESKKKSRTDISEDLVPPLLAQVLGREVRILEPKGRSDKAFIEKAIYPPQNPKLPPGRGRLNEPPIYLLNNDNRTHYNYLRPTESFLKNERATADQVDMAPAHNSPVQATSAQANQNQQAGNFFSATDLFQKFEGWNPNDFNNNHVLKTLDNFMRGFRSEFMADDKQQMDPAVWGDNCFSRCALFSALLFEELNNKGLARYPGCKDDKKANIEVLGSIRIDYESGRKKHDEYGYHVAPLIRIKHKDPYQQERFEIVTADPIYGFLPVKTWHDCWKIDQDGKATHEDLNYVPVNELYVGNNRPNNENRLNVEDFLATVEQVGSRDVYTQSSFDERINHAGFRDMVWNMLQSKGAESETVHYRDNVGEAFEKKEQEKSKNTKKSKKSQPKKTTGKQTSSADERREVRRAVDKNLRSAMDNHPTFSDKDNHIRKLFFPEKES